MGNGSKEVGEAERGTETVRNGKIDRKESRKRYLDHKGSERCMLGISCHHRTPFPLKNPSKWPSRFITLSWFSTHVQI